MCIVQGDIIQINSAIKTWIKILFLYAHARCMPELCCKFQIPASNTVGVAETNITIV